MVYSQVPFDMVCEILAVSVKVFTSTTVASWYVPSTLASPCKTSKNIVSPTTKLWPFLVIVIVVPDCVQVADVEVLFAAGILVFIPRIRKALFGIELNCSESKRKCV